MDRSSGDVGERLARALGAQYEVRSVLGRGGFAEVYEAWDRSLDRRLAVKVLREDVAWTSGMLARFRQEAKAVAQLAHPNILPIHFVAEAEGLVFYAMPYVEGRSLGDLLRQGGALEPDQAVAIARPIFDALHHAHERGLIHRDIKPDNIMLEAGSGRPLLVDFGIAKRMDGGQGLTQTGFVVGTPHYMSPEQALGQVDLDSRSDLYAMGAVLYQMVTGTPPFEGDSSQEIVAQHITAPPPLATDVNARIPRWLSDVIVRCLAKRPPDRYQSARDAAAALATGRASGSHEGVPAARVAAAVRDEGVRPSAPTVVTPSSGGDAARAGAHRPPSRGRWVVAGGILLGTAGFAAYRLLGPAPVTIVNRLAEPLVVLAADGRERTVDPGAELRVAQPASGALHWRLVRPSTPEGTTMGLELSGVLTGFTRAAARREIASRVGDLAHFAPLITNATDQALSVTVNAGLQGATSCGCVVPPGATRMRIGYYPLYRNSTVRVETPSGRWAQFNELGPSVDGASGTVGLRFEDRDLRR